jgi:hypothetical protein
LEVVVHQEVLAVVVVAQLGRMAMVEMVPVLLVNLGPVTEVVVVAEQTVEVRVLRPFLHIPLAEMVDLIDLDPVRVMAPLATVTQD